MGKKLNNKETEKPEKSYKKLELMAYLFLFFAGASLSSISVIVDAIAVSMGVKVSVAVASFTFMNLSISIMVFATTGILLGFLSLKKVSILTSLLLFIGITFLLFVKTVLMLNIALFVYGIGYGMSFALGYYYIVIVTNNKTRAAKMALVSICYSGGAMLSPKICNFLLHKGVSWNITISCFILVIVAAFIVSLFTDFNVEGTTGGKSPKTHLKVERNWIEEVRSWPITVYLMVIALASYTIAEMIVVLWLAVFGHEVMGMPKDLAASLPAMFWGSIIIGRIIATYVLKVISQEIYLCIICTVSSLVLFLMSVIEFSFVMALLVVTLGGISFAATYSTTAAVGTIQVPKASGKLTSVILGSGAFGTVLAPIFSSLVDVEHVLLQTAFFMILIPILVIIVKTLNKARGYNPNSAG